MFSFLLIIAIITLGGLFFGKADRKKEILNSVGLDLSQNNYETKKEEEFQKYPVQAMKKVIDFCTYQAKNENDFLEYMLDILWRSEDGGYAEDSWIEKRPLYIGVKKHYIKHAETIVYRRQKDISNGNTKPLVSGIDFSDKKIAKRYCEILWKKYQYPWPQDWNQRDND
ncbi:MAG: hypothetical protein IJK84_11415 [Bacteroidales bacterium]|nr:hypothetical protein [Bacteroidales bacterium]